MLHLARAAAVGLAAALASSGSFARADAQARAHVEQGRNGERAAFVVVDGPRAQRIALRGSLPVLDPHLEARFADFDGDGRADLVVRPRRPTRSSVWLVFAFDARLGRFRTKPWVFVSSGRRAFSSPAPDCVIDLLFDQAKELGGAGTASAPRGRAGVLAVQRGGEIEQLLAADDVATLGEHGEGAAMRDLNFDGHADLLVRVGGADNDWYRAWLFDPSKNRFVDAPAFAELPNVEVDAGRRELVSRLNRGAAGAIFRERRYRSTPTGGLELVREVEQDEDLHGRTPPGVPADALLFTLRARERQGGRMKLVCDALVDVGADRWPIVHIARGDAATCAH
jgi:hypothetical protein